MSDHRLDDATRSEAISAFVAAQNAAVLEVADQGLLTLAGLISSDGKQRLTSISVFLNDELILRGLSRLATLNGLKYSQLPTEIRNPLGMKALRTTTLLRQSDPDLKHEVFLRLNTGGEILNAQEIRNVAYRGPANDLIYQLAENSFLRKQLKVIPPSSSAYRQMVDAEFVLRFLTLERGWVKFRGDLRGAFDDFMLRNRFSSRESLDSYRSSFNTCIAAAEAVWGGWAFKRPGRDQVLAGLYDSQMVALAELGAARHQSLIRQRTEVQDATDALFDDQRFDEAVRLGTNTPARLRTRVRMMLQTLEQFAGRHGAR